MFISPVPDLCSILQHTEDIMNHNLIEHANDRVKDGASTRGSSNNNSNGDSGNRRPKHGAPYISQTKTKTKTAKEATPSDTQQGPHRPESWQQKLESMPPSMAFALSLSSVPLPKSGAAGHGGHGHLSNMVTRTMIGGLKNINQSHHHHQHVNAQQQQKAPAGRRRLADPFYDAKPMAPDVPKSLHSQVTTLTATTKPSPPSPIIDELEGLPDTSDDHSLGSIGSDIFDEQGRNRNDNGDNRNGNGNGKGKGGIHNEDPMPTSRAVRRSANVTRRSSLDIASESINASFAPFPSALDVGSSLAEVLSVPQLPSLTLPPVSLISVLAPTPTPSNLDVHIQASMTTNMANASQSGARPYAKRKLDDDPDTMLEQPEPQSPQKKIKGEDNAASDGGPDGSTMSPTSPGRFRVFQSEQWKARYEELIQFRDTYGHCLVPNTYARHPTLFRWVKRQRYQFKLLNEGKQSTMTTERIAVLNDIGFVWDTLTSQWETRLNELKEFRELHGHSNVPSTYGENPKLAIWVKCQRRQYKKLSQNQPSNISEERIKKLNQLDFVWKARPSK